MRLGCERMEVMMGAKKGVFSAPTFEIANVKILQLDDRIASIGVSEPRASVLLIISLF